MNPGANPPVGRKSAGIVLRKSCTGCPMDEQSFPNQPRNSRVKARNACGVIAAGKIYLVQLE